MYIDDNSAAEKAITEDELGSRFVFLTGLNHGSADISLREQLAVRPGSEQSVLSAALEVDAVEEAVVISTCNRVELITSGSSRGVNPQKLQQCIETVFEKNSGIERKKFQSHLYHYQGQQAVSHVFRVACGLDSQVLGEPQILGQLKDSFFRAKDLGSTQSTLNHLFQRAFGVAKTVRTQTQLGQRAVSLAYAVRELGAQILDLERSTVLLIGAGEMGALALRYLARSNVKHFYVANKTVERAAALAEECGGAALALSSVAEMLEQVDLIIGAAQVPGEGEYFIRDRDVAAALQKRRGHLQLYVDLGVPRNFAPAIAALENAFLYNIDDLEGIVQQNLDKRLLEAKRAELIVDSEVEKFLRWAQTRCLVPLIKDAQQNITSSCRDELKRWAPMLRAADIERLSESLSRKILHQPLSILKERGPEDPTICDNFSEFFKKS